METVNDFRSKPMARCASTPQRLPARRHFRACGPAVLERYPTCKYRPVTDGRFVDIVATVSDAGIRRFDPRVDLAAGSRSWVENSGKPRKKRAGRRR